MGNKKHLYHLVENNQWPVMASMGVWNLAMGLLMVVNKGEKMCLFLGFVVVLMSMYGWFSDMMSEATYQGAHTKVVQSGLMLGFMLFMLSEMMVFFGVFWAFFHSSLVPAMELGLFWPGVNIQGVSPKGLPLLNTMILVTSGFTVTASHSYLSGGSFKLSMIYLVVTILLGLLFFFFFFFEYFKANVNITDGIYGTCFFSMTGLHGFHVFVGIMFLMVCLFRLAYGHYNSQDHYSYEFAIWYWHFVDIIWMFVMIFVYGWSMY